jgi:hypothetical protein
VDAVSKFPNGDLDPLNFDETAHRKRYPGVPDEIDFYATIEEWERAEQARLAATAEREASFPEKG